MDPFLDIFISKLLIDRITPFQVQKPSYGLTSKIWFQIYFIMYSILLGLYVGLYVGGLVLSRPAGPFNKIYSKMV